MAARDGYSSGFRCLCSGANGKEPRGPGGGGACTGGCHAPAGALGPGRDAQVEPAVKEGVLVATSVGAAC